jgi:polygalacturonase
MRLALILLITFSSLFSHASQNSIFNVKDFGAIGDGNALDTEAIQKAVDECEKLNGGTVLFPAGEYVTGTIYLKDNVTLDIPAGTKILGSIDIKDYPVNNPDIEFYSSHRIHFSLFYAEGKKGITLKGKGTIDGRGSNFSDKSELHPKHYRARPYILWFVKCFDITVKDLFLTSSGYWMQHYLASEKILIDGIQVFNHCNKNNDMMDIDGCKNVRILNCIGDSDDDGITIKSTSNYPSENIVVTNCIISSHCNAIKCGTESSGGFKNITISNCVVKPSEVSDKVIYGRPAGNSGITLVAVDGGTLDGVLIDNIRISGPRVPIFLRRGNRARPYKKEQGDIPVSGFRNVQISNITASGASNLGCMLAGIPDYPIENIKLTNITITFSGGGTHEDATKVLPEDETKYPDIGQFGIMNAYGFQVRHARNMTMKNISLRFENEDKRAPLILDDVDNFTISEMDAMVSPESESFIKIRNSGRTYISNCKPVVNGKVKAFLKLEGNNRSNIYITGSDLSKVNKKVDAGKSELKKVVLAGNIK